jgi:hypothetical protein
MVQVVIGKEIPLNRCGQNGQMWVACESRDRSKKTMSNSGENFELFYICYFLDILKLC